MKIFTNRLEIRPLSSSQLKSYISDSLLLTKELKLWKPLDQLDDHMKKVYHLKAKRIETLPSSLLYNTYFIIILKEERVAIGTLGLTGLPDQDGLVEVGYAINENYRNQGFMREGLESFAKWLLQIREVSGINACTSKENIASHKVLEACHFEKVFIEKDMIMWRFTSI